MSESRDPAFKNEHEPDRRRVNYILGRGEVAWKKSIWKSRHNFPLLSRAINSVVGGGRADASRTVRDKRI